MRQEVKFIRDCTLFNADAYEKFDTLSSGGVAIDSIITDPPYNISQKNNFATMNCVRQGVDFGEWDRGNFDLYSWIPKYVGLLSENGSAIIFCSYRYISHIIETLEENGMVAKDVIVWQKSNPMPRNAGRRYVQDMEFAVWAVKKRAKWTFNKPPGKPYIRSLFTTPLVSGRERVGHPTQKSLRLMEDIISIHTNPGDIILDPFMGSGTTGVAALNLGRKFIGIELDGEYFEMARRRLALLERGDVGA